MSDRREAAITHARSVLAANAGMRAESTEVEKTIWGSPAGKKRLANRLVAMLPAHKTYVEPFAGSAAVLFAKEPSDVEVINDADLEIADAYRLVKKLTPEGLAKLKKLPWVGDEKTFKRLLDVEPEDDVERLHRFLYLTHFSYGKMRGQSFSPTVVGVEATTIKRIEKFAPRLKKVKVYGGDYEKVVRKYDTKDTAFFLDPPYPGYNVDVGEGEFDEERFFKLLKSLKGRFLITYGIRGKFPALVKGSDFWSKRIRTRRSIAHMRGPERKGGHRRSRRRRGVPPPEHQGDDARARRGAEPPLRVDRHAGELRQGARHDAEGRRRALLQARLRAHPRP